MGHANKNTQITTWNFFMTAFDRWFIHLLCQEREMTKMSEEQKEQLFLNSFSK